MHATLCNLITDIAQNAIEAKASAIHLKIAEEPNNLNVEIIDNGIGMNRKTLEKAKDPFYSDGTKHKHRKVGLGLPFLFQTVEQTGSQVTIESKEGNGTTVRFKLNKNHVDLPEFGDFAAAAVTLMAYDFDGDLTIERSINGRRYKISKAEVKKILGDLNRVENLTLLKRFIEENEKEIRQESDKMARSSSFK